MQTLLAALTLGALALAAWHHAAWPLLLSRIARRQAPSPVPLVESALPAITLVMPAYNEAAFIARKLRNLAALDYPKDRLLVILACDGCTDGTVAIAEATLQEPDCAGLRAEIRDLRPNRGKLGVLNELIGALPPGIVALSDISAMLPPDALRRAAAHFADPRLGAVGGTYVLERAGSAGEAKYWQYQVAVKRGEAALGAPLGLHGAFWAFRREAWSPLPPDTINDDFLWPAHMAERGWRIAYDETIRTREAEVADAGLDARRRRRIAAGNAQQLWRARGLLHPRHGGIALAFLSGKALRVVMPFLLLAAALGTLALVPVSNFFLFLAICEAFCVLLAACGWLLGSRAPKPLAILNYLVTGHLASAIGVARYLLFRPRQPWRRAADTAPA
ncbi:glycosyltransferase family 2 protein [Dankookia sp. GCM10030260]|uniref:glycosyltransferase family 2 protein n=1 Tax=Dankookia sp. GCM10030260 TaxID=3273390 RepID=UPI003622A639